MRGPMNSTWFLSTIPWVCIFFSMHFRLGKLSNDWKNERMQEREWAMVPQQCTFETKRKWPLISRMCCPSLWPSSLSTEPTHSMVCHTVLPRQTSENFMTLWTVFGESYAGKYVPSLSSYIQQKQPPVRADRSSTPAKSNLSIDCKWLEYCQFEGIWSGRWIHQSICASDCTRWYGL